VCCACSLHVSVLGNQEAVRMDTPFKRIGLSVWNSETIELHGQSISNQRLLERLEAENAQLRGSAVDLLLQIQALRDRLARPQSEPPLVRRRPFGLSHAAMAGCSSMA